MKLNELRNEIEKIDYQIIELIKERLDISIKIGNYKKENNLKILDEKREIELIQKYKDIYNDDKTYPYYREVLDAILKTSKDIQNG